MGLPLAPEIARFVTAYQLDTRFNLVPPVAFSLYFDNLYTTHDPAMMLDVFLPFTLTEEPFNTLKDAGYLAELQEFCPNPYELKSPIPIHPHSSHLHRRMILKTYLSTVHSLAAICSDPNIGLHTCFSRFLTNLRFFGRDPVYIITEIASIAYFPTPTTRYQYNQLYLLHLPSNP